MKPSIKALFWAVIRHLGRAVGHAIAGRRPAHHRLQIVPVFGNLAILDAEHVERDEGFGPESLGILIGHVQDHEGALSHHAVDGASDATLLKGRNEAQNWCGARGDADIVLPVVLGQQVPGGTLVKVGENGADSTQNDITGGHSVSPSAVPKDGAFLVLF